MDTKNFDFAAQIYSVKDMLDKILQQYDDAQALIKKLKADNTRLENEVYDKNAEIKDLSRQNSNMQGEIENLRDNLNRTKADLNSETKHRQQLEISLQNTNLQLDDTTRQLANTTSQLNDTTAQLQDYAEKYADIEQAYNSYKKLSDTTKFALQGIFGDAVSPTNFLAGALPEDHLKSLFDYVATAINSGTNPAEIDILHGIFEFAFNAANNGRREKIFTRLNVSAGNTFDSDEMRKTSSSAQSGTVQKVLLVGYKFSRTGKIVKPSLVVIG
ncbi:MAG: hypothetical protein IJU91_02705 [Selenomonadaceae bacterium]|nr:hypothetical protein [Selenomonadaceae bacterium]